MTKSKDTDFIFSIFLEVGWKKDCLHALCHMPEAIPAGALSPEAELLLSTCPVTPRTHGICSCPGRRQQPPLDPPSQDEGTKRSVGRDRNGDSMTHGPLLKHFSLRSISVEKPGPRTSPGMTQVCLLFPTWAAVWSTNQDSPGP